MKILNKEHHSAIFTQTRIFVLFVILGCVLEFLSCTPKSALNTYRPYKFLSDTLSVLPDTLIAFERTPCYGTCPAYRMRIYGNGKVQFEKYSWRGTKGLIESKLSKEKVAELIHAFNIASFFSMKDSYDDFEHCEEVWTCMPSVIISIKLGYRFKKVYHYHGCKGFKLEEQLYTLEEMVDQIVNTEQWIK